MRYRYTEGSDPDFILLCGELDDFLNRLAGGVENRAGYLPYNHAEDVPHVILAYEREKPAGCAGFRRYDAQRAEIKRVFIRGEYRGRGLSRELLARLEQAAKEQGYSYLLLETGEELVPAMALYRAAGFEIIPNYAPYENMPESVCMKKRL